MATSIALNTKFTASIDQFQSSMDKVAAKLDEMGGHTKGAADSLRLLAKIEVGKLIVSGLSAATNMLTSAVGSMKGFAQQAAASADAVGKLSSATGFSAESLQVFGQYATYNGVSTDKFGEAAKRMTKRLAEAQQGFGEALPALNKLGLDIDALAKMKPEQAFMAIGSAIGQLPTKGEQAAVAFKIFSDQGLAMVPLFNDLEAGVRGTADEMLALGQVLSTTQVRSIEAMNDSFEKVKKTATSIGTQVLANFAPLIEHANNKILEFIKNFQFNGEVGGQAIANMLTETAFDVAEVLARWVESAKDMFFQAVTMLEGIIHGFGKVFEALTGTTYDGSLLDLKKYQSELAQSYQNQARQIDSAMSDYEVLKMVTGGLVDVTDKSGEMQKERNRLIALAQKTEEEYIAGRKKAMFGEANALEAVMAAREVHKKQLNEAAKNTADFAGRVGESVAASKKVTSEFDIASITAKMTGKSLEKFGGDSATSAKQLQQLALDAEKFGPNAELARIALDGMKDATLKATPASKLFGERAGVSGDALRDLALAAEKSRNDMSVFGKDIEELGKAAGLSQSEMSTLERVVRETGGPFTELGKQLTNLADSTRHLNKVQEDLSRSMMKPYEDFANQRADQLKKMGYNPFFVEDEKRKWLAQQQEMVNKHIEFQRQAYEKFKERIGEGVGDAIKEVLENNTEVEETLPELRSQTRTLGDILTAVKRFPDAFIEARF